jgi:hypothetical protein
MVPKSDTLERRGLARGLRIWLDLLLVILLLAAITVVIIWPVLSWAGHESYQITVPVSIDKDALSPTGEYGGLSLQETRGKLKYLPDTFAPKLVFWFVSVVGVAVLAYGLILLRRLLAETGRGLPFHPDNPRRLNHLGWLIVSTSLAATVAEFLAGRWILSNPELSGLPVSPLLKIDQGWIFVGLLILVLAAIWKEAVRMAEDQSLTV